MNYIQKIMRILIYKIYDLILIDKIYYKMYKNLLNKCERKRWGGALFLYCWIHLIYFLYVTNNIFIVNLVNFVLYFLELI